MQAFCQALTKDATTSQVRDIVQQIAPGTGPYCVLRGQVLSFDLANEFPLMSDSALLAPCPLRLCVAGRKR